MKASKLDGCPSNSFLTLVICLQCSDNNFGGGDVSSNVLYVPGCRVDLICVEVMYQAMFCMCQGAGLT